MNAPHSADDESHRVNAKPLAAHICELTEQAREQVYRLVTALDTHIFLDSMLAPSERGDEACSQLFPSLDHLLVLKHALNAELRRHVQALAHTTDALHACATSKT